MQFEHLGSLIGQSRGSSKQFVCREMMAWFLKTSSIRMWCLLPPTPTESSGSSQVSTCSCAGTKQEADPGPTVILEHCAASTSAAETKVSTVKLTSPHVFTNMFRKKNEAQSTSIPTTPKGQLCSNLHFLREHPHHGVSYPPHTCRYADSICELGLPRLSEERCLFTWRERCTISKSPTSLQLSRNTPPLWHRYQLNIISYRTRTKDLHIWTSRKWTKRSNVFYFPSRIQQSIMSHIITLQSHTCFLIRQISMRRPWNTSRDLWR